MKFCFKDFYSKCEELLKKSLNLTFCLVMHIYSWFPKAGCSIVSCLYLEQLLQFGIKPCSLATSFNLFIQFLQNRLNLYIAYIINQNYHLFSVSSDIFAFTSQNFELPAVQSSPLGSKALSLYPLRSGGSQLSAASLTLKSQYATLSNKRRTS